MYDWLKPLRISMDKTQEQVAFHANISRAAYTNIENGERRPSVKTAKKIADTLGFPWLRFFDDHQ